MDKTWEICHGLAVTLQTSPTPWHTMTAIFEVRSLIDSLDSLPWPSLQISNELINRIAMASHCGHGDQEQTFQHMINKIVDKRDAEFFYAARGLLHLDSWKENSVVSVFKTQNWGRTMMNIDELCKSRGRHVVVQLPTLLRFFYYFMTALDKLPPATGVVYQGGGSSRGRRKTASNIIKQWLDDHVAFKW